MMNEGFKRIYWYIGLFMSILILCLGIALLTTDIAYEAIPQPNRKWLAIVFLIYSVIRGARVYQQYVKFKTKQDD